MYSTWTRFNPFILYADGLMVNEMVQFLRMNYPDSPIRGYVKQGYVNYAPD